MTSCKTSRPCSGLIMANETIRIDSEWEKTTFKTAYINFWNHYIKYKQFFNDKTGKLSSDWDWDLGLGI